MKEDLYIVEKWNEQWGCFEYWLRNYWQGSKLEDMKLSVNRDHATKMKAREARRICTILNHRDGGGVAWEVEPTPFRAHNWKV